MDKIPSRPDRQPWQRRLERKERRPADQRERDKWLKRAPWLRCRAHKLSLDPLCQDCRERGELVAAAQVHHVVAREVDPARAYDLDNLRSLCLACHRRQENAEKNHDRPGGEAHARASPVVRAVIGTSGGPIATAAAQQHLKAILSHFNAPTLGQPEGYVQSLPGLFTESGEVTSDTTAEFLVGYLDAFNVLIDRYVPARSVAVAA